MTHNENEGGVAVPVPDPGADLNDLAVFDDAGTGVSDDTSGALHASTAGYDAETDVAVPAATPSPESAFTPFGASVPPTTPQPAYDLERDTGV